MYEIQCHPWVTYTEFPKYIDHKFAKDKTVKLRKRRNIIPAAYLNKIRKTSGLDQFKNESEILDAINKNNNSSFIIEIKLQQTESFERKRELKLEKKRLELTENKSGTSLKNKYSFNLLSRLFSDIALVTHFQNTFNMYTIQHNSALINHPWRIGFSFSINLKKILKNFFITANKLKIKVVPIKKEDFKFRCSILENAESTQRSFILQVFENIGEYILDLKNESCSKMEFMILSFKLFKMGKRELK